MSSAAELYWPEETTSSLDRSMTQWHSAYDVCFQTK